WSRVVADRSREENFDAPDVRLPARQDSLYLSNAEVAGVRSAGGVGRGRSADDRRLRKSSAAVDQHLLHARLDRRLTRGLRRSHAADAPRPLREKRRGSGRDDSARRPHHVLEEPDARGGARSGAYGATFSRPAVGGTVALWSCGASPSARSFFP